MGKAIYCDRCGTVKKIPTFDRNSSPIVMSEPWMHLDIPDLHLAGDKTEKLLCPPCASDFERFMKEKQRV
jgi:hypothetical protein